MQRLGGLKKSRLVNWNQNILGLHHVVPSYPSWKNPEVW